MIHEHSARNQAKEETQRATPREEAAATPEEEAAAAATPKEKAEAAATPEEEAEAATAAAATEPQASHHIIHLFRCCQPRPGD